MFSDNYQDVLNDCREALKTNWNDFSAWLKMAGALLEQSVPVLYPICLTCCEKSLQLRPNNPDAYIKKGIVLARLGRSEEAISALQRAQQLAPESVYARFLLLVILCPILYKKEEEISSTRTTYFKLLIELCDSIDLHDSDSILRASKAVGEYPFYLCYQGFNDKELQKYYGKLICKIQAARYPQWSLPIPSQHIFGEPIRVGIVSGFFRYHSVWKIITRGWLSVLDKNRFALYGYSTGHSSDAYTSVARNTFIRFVENDFSLESLCCKILEDRIDVLIYPEIGMDRMTIRLSALRLAPVQCCSHGHPTTSGLPTIDYFLSSDLMEPADGADHYTETLIRLPNLGFHYIPPDMSLQLSGHDIPGIKKDAILYICAQSLFKYLPQYDEVFPRIAQKTGNCQFVFMANYIAKPSIAIFRSRLTAAFNIYNMCSENYIFFMDDSYYANLLEQGDVFLDSIGWSGCTSTMEAVTCDLPVVTLPGNLMRGRQTMAILKMMGMNETIADSLDHYVEIAVRLGTDKQLRERVRKQVSSNKHKLYRDRECIDFLESFLENAVEAQRIFM